ncbi:TerB family tellurite resistance protein [Methylocystis rosea]|uniref:TerB family tellurite resistance protein n=1 Tax=Methylocystis rosea TaxID=173366 RepID=A0A3G8M331_9HYPH|nr:TerB family tellurite resistance protein [Methylocystis rosea]AZG75328.1 TerB family tellurite resistance protein [Methylocystis rosea]
MFSALKNFINELTGEAERPKAFEAADYQLAAAALLVHIASVDGQFDDKEKARIRQLVEARFNLQGDDAAELIDAAQASERDAVDLYRFTSVLKRRLDEDGRRQIIGMLWDMAHADGAVHEFEENVVWRVAELLGVSTRERVELRREFREAAVPAPTGPWSPSKGDGR